MKTTIELNGYQIEIEENEGTISVKAEKDGDVVEEFVLSSDESQDDEDEDFDSEESQEGDDDDDDDFDSEESQDDDDEDFGDDDNGGEESDDDDLEEESLPSKEEPKLETFQSFFKKRKK
jgi:hypothetical protein